MVLLVAVLSAPQQLSGRVAAAPSQVPDAWGSKITWRTTDGWYAAPIHASLMPDGRILFFGLKAPTEDLTKSSLRTAWIFTPPPVPGPFPAEMTISELTQPVDGNLQTSGNYLVYDLLNCSGHALTADGKFYSAGGERLFINSGTGQLAGVVGLRYGTIFDGTSWTRVPGFMAGAPPNGESARWYPTVTRLPDNRLLITSGFDKVSPTPSVNLTAEVYDPAAQSYALLSPFGQAPTEIFNGNYTHIGVLPVKVGGADVVEFGSPGVPAFMSLSPYPAPWRLSSRVRPGSEAWNQARLANAGNYQYDTAPDYGASSVMLPIRVNDGDLGYRNGTMLIAGGAFNTQFVQQVDRYDPQADAWLSSLDQGVQRHDPGTIVLPDGRVLIIGGESSDPNVTRAEYVDTLFNFAVTLGMSDGVEVRGYHNVSLLLPDGRVIIAGGRDLVTASSAEKPSFRMYYPQYMYVADRPAITAAPPTLSYGQPVQLSGSNRPPVMAMLIGLGSMTHSFDENERAIELAVNSTSLLPGGDWAATLTAPTSPQIAPAGYYMLFVTDGRRIPSMAKIVKLG
jgi:hypothetical protein